MARAGWLLAARNAGVIFSIHQYDHDPAAESYGEEAADRLGINPGKIFKTLVTQDENSRLTVCIVPVLKSLDLKVAASVLKVKKMQLADKDLVQRNTGYVIGGVSPLGQKKVLPTIVDRSVQNFEKIYVSGGRRGLEISLPPGDLIRLCSATLAPIAR